MRFPDSFLDEIRDRVPISSVIGARVSWDRRKTNAARGDYWACCPFHGEKSAELPLRGQEGPLPLLRLRRVGRSFPLPDRTRRHELSRGGRAHRRPGRRADAGARRGREARPAARQPDRRHGAGDEVLPGAAAVGGRRQGARLSARPRPVAGDAAVVPARLCARQPQRAEGIPGRQGRRPRRRWRPAA